MLIAISNGDHLKPALISAVVVNHIGSPCVTIHWGNPCGFMSVVPYDSLDMAKKAAKDLAWHVAEVMSQESDRQPWQPRQDRQPCGCRCKCRSAEVGEVVGGAGVAGVSAVTGELPVPVPDGDVAPLASLAKRVMTTPPLGWPH